MMINDLRQWQHDARLNDRVRRLAGDAADEIAALRARAEAAERELAGRLCALDDTARRGHDLAAENERLRAALVAIIDRAEHRMSWKVSDDVVTLARSALRGCEQHPIVGEADGKE